MGAVALHLIGAAELGSQMVITGEEFSMTGEAIASPVNMLKYALFDRTHLRTFSKYQRAPPKPLPREAFAPTQPARP